MVFLVVWVRNMSRAYPPDPLHYGRIRTGLFAQKRPIGTAAAIDYVIDCGAAQRIWIL